MNRASKVIRVAVVISLLAIFGAAAVFTRNWMFDNAGLAMKEGRYSDALAKLKPLASLGDSSAQRFVGDFYAFGWGVAKNDETAISWYKRVGKISDSVGDPSAEAMNFVGRRYLGGQGVPRDEGQARKWLERSEQAGYPSAHEALQTLKN
jgi:TPR repeat protein